MLNVLNLMCNVVHITMCVSLQTEVREYNENIYTCGGWKGLVAQDYDQFIWRVTFSVYFAVILLLSIISIPFHCTFRSRLL